MSGPTAADSGATVPVSRFRPPPRQAGPSRAGRGLVDFYSTHPQYVEHMEPIWAALDPAVRGEWYQRRVPPAGVPRLTLVASFGNLIMLRGAGRPCAYMEHGAGFTYQGGGNPFAGGRDRPNVELFLDMNEAVRARNAAAHPATPGVVVGAPKLDRVFTADPRPRGRPPVVAFSFHWDYHRIPEARSAFLYYRPAIIELARRVDHRDVPFRLLGHAHPRVAMRMRTFWLGNRVPFVRSFGDVLGRADLYVVDTSSTAYEAAAAGIPVLTLNAPWYRRGVEHGLRFWRHIPGLAIDRPDELEAGILTALDDAPELARRRAEAVAAVYPIRDGTSAARAAEALTARARALAAGAAWTSRRPAG